MELDPVDLYYEEYGQGTAMVLLHGFPFDHTIWEPLIPLLKQEARLILPDLRGFGRSPVPEGTYSMRLLAEDVAQLLDRLGIEKAMLVGHSMGGYVSLAFAQAYPGRLLGLGLVATHSAADSPERRQARNKLAVSALHKGARVVASDLVNNLTPKKELLEPINELILRAHPTGIAGALRGMAERHDLTGELSSLVIPAVVMVGKEDRLLNHELVKTMAQMLPKGWLVEIPDAGHMLTLEYPNQVAGTLHQLLKMAVNSV
jgi:pimeloyl-ACP methyl ester carboxylesterase